MRTRSGRITLFVAGVLCVAALGGLAADLFEAPAGAQAELTREDLFFAAQTELQTGTVETWRVDADAAEMWGYGSRFRARARLAEEFGDASTAFGYWTLAADVANALLTAHPDVPQRTRVHMLEHDAVRALLGMSAGLDDLEARIPEIWLNLTDFADRHEMAKQLRKRAVQARRAADQDSTGRYGALTRDGTLALAGEEPFHPSIAHVVELYYAMIPGVAPEEPGQRSVTKSLRPMIEEARQTRAAVDALVSAIDANPGGVFEFCGAYSAGYCEEVLLGERETGQALYARAQAVLDSGAVDAALADPALTETDACLLNLLIGHCYAANGFKDAARAQYEFFKTRFPERTGHIGQADMGLMRLQHGDPSNKHADRVAMSRAFIVAHPAHHLAWSLAEQREGEYAARYRVADAAEMWLALAEAHPESARAVEAYAEGLDVLLTYKHFVGAAAATNRLLAAASGPETAAGVLYHSASLPLAQGDTDGARAVYAQVTRAYRGTTWAALAAEALASLDAQAR